MNSLIYDINGNDVEVFNRLATHYIGGKRINYCKNNFYESRCYGYTILIKFFTETIINTYMKNKIIE